MPSATLPFRSASSKNSTNVRSLDTARAPAPVPAAPQYAAAPERLSRRRPPRWLRAALRTAATVAPPLATRWAEKLFATPPRVRARPSPVLDAGHRFFVEAGAHRLAVWSWGDGPTAMLLHGWGGRSDQLVPFVSPLLAAGFSVVAPDAPAHGDSSGRTSSVLAFADALEAVAARVGPIDAFVGHSAGAAAGALAMHRGLRVRRAVFVAPVASLTDVVVRFAWQLHIPPWIADAMRKRFESRLGVPMSSLEVSTLARHAPAPLLVFHDPADPEVPWHDAAAIAQAWPGTRLVDAPGLGHNRILREPGIVAEAVSFLSTRQ
jgi:pimeloyl-ACP methyl ester carboxylesterase